MKIERQLQGTLNTVMTELIKEKKLDNRIQPYPTQEEGRADITLKNKSGKPIFFIELKDPTAKDGRSVFDSNVLFREVQRAQKLEIDYFGNCNFLACAFFDKDKMYERATVREGLFTLQDIKKLSISYQPGKEIEKKLRSIAEFYLDRALEILDRKPITFSNLDELFIFKIQKLIEVFAPSISESVWERYQNEKKFRADVHQYTQSQLWNKVQSIEEIENLTHIALLMLISKLIFYKAYVDNQTWHNLHPMKLPNSVETSKQLEECIWTYFDEFKEVTGNFELLIGERHDIIFQIPFVSDSSIELVNDVLETEGHYNFSQIPYDIVGRIFEELIREDERHKLGQYFTPPDVIDLINAFAINRSNDKVFDPSCGSGTFLVRAYERKRELCRREDKGARHEILLNEIYGNDLSGYPAYLSMLNLAIRNTKRPSYPRILNKDFFAIRHSSMLDFHTKDGELERKQLPKFDAIIGNPPYTRQEDIGSMSGTVTKAQIQQMIKAEAQVVPSQRTSIYAYFFYHSAIFLKDEGYLAFIVQNSWLDTDYGTDLQRYLTSNFEIVAIMDSAIERFFPTASVNTTIVILRKQKKEEERNRNNVRFVYFTDTLSNTLKTIKGPENLRDLILNTKENTENAYYKLNILLQSKLLSHSKWSQFLKAPKIYFEILARGQDVWEPLNKYAEVQRGYTTGFNELFVFEDLTDKVKDDQVKLAVNNNLMVKLSELKRKSLKLVKNGFNELWIIETAALKPILTSPKDVKDYQPKPDELPYCFLRVNDEKSIIKNELPFTFAYIQYCERNKHNQRSTLTARRNWYSLTEREIPDLSFSYMINDFGRTFNLKAYSNDNHHNVHYKSKQSAFLFYFLNSTLSWLLQQVEMKTNFGDGVGKIQVYDLRNLLVCKFNISKLNVKLGATKNYQEELGNLSSLKTVNPERVKLDSAILEAIGYTDKKEREEVLLELYKATYEMITNRLEKAQSQKTIKSQRNKVTFDLYVAELKQLLVDEKAQAKKTVTFAKQVQQIVRQITSDTKLQKQIMDRYWKEKFGEAYNEKKVAGAMQGKMF